MLYDINRLRETLPLPDLMQRLGLGEHAKKTAFCPFHHNRNTGAFSVYQKEGRWWWNCFAGCGSGDEIALLQKLEGFDFRGAVKRWAELAGVCSLEGAYQPHQNPRAGVPQSTPKIVELPKDFREGTEAELQIVASGRGVSIFAVALMQCHGVLRFGTVCCFPCWIVTDVSRRVAEARRMDGLKFPVVGSLAERKAHTLRGSLKSWPVGLALPDDRHRYFDRVVLVEGSGDLVAAYEFACSSSDGQRWLPIAMLGAGTQISNDALPLLFGKEIRIVPHEDASGAGRGAEETWRSSLQRAGLRGSTYSLAGLRRRDGSLIKDLNDCVDVHPGDRAQLEGLLK